MTDKETRSSVTPTQSVPTLRAALHATVTMDTLGMGLHAQVSTVYKVSGLIVAWACWGFRATSRVKHRLSTVNLFPFVE